MARRNKQRAQRHRAKPPRPAAPWLLLAAPIEGETPRWVAVAVDQEREEVSGWAVESDRDDAAAAALASALEHGRPGSLHAAPELRAAAARHDLEAHDFADEHRPLVEVFQQLLAAHGPEIGAGRDPLMLQFLEVCADVHRALAGGEDDAVAEIARTGEDRALAMIRPGVDGAVIVLHPDDLDRFEDAMARGEPLSVATRGVAFLPIAECDDALIDELQEHGWEHQEVLPIVHVTDKRGRATEPDADTLIELADLFEVLLGAGLQDAVHGRLEEPSFYLEGASGRTARIDWRASLDEWEGSLIDGDLIELEARLPAGVIRRFAVRGGLTLAELHWVVQASIDGGLHQPHWFEFEGQRYAPLDADATPGTVPADRHRLDELVEPGDKVIYHYAAGDGDGYEIEVTATREADDEDPPAACIGGAGAGYDAAAIAERIDDLF